MLNPDIVFINPGNGKAAYQNLAADLTAIEPPVWAGLLAAHAEKKGFRVSIIDANADGLTFAQTAMAAIKANPKLIAVVVYGHNPSASTQLMPAVREICISIKKLSPESKIILIGGHVTALPLQTMKEECCDFVCDGEGPLTLHPLLKALSEKNESWHRIPDLWYHNEGQIVRSNMSAPLIKNLDEELSSLAWHLLPMEKYRAHNWHGFGQPSRAPYAAIYTTLGCPYHCDFCCIQAPFKNGERTSGMGSNISSYRFWSPEFVLNQIDLLVNRYQIQNLKIADEMFILNEAHVSAICQGIIDRGYNLNIWAYARVDTVQEKMLALLRKAGIRWLALGVESSNETIRTNVSKQFAQNLIRERIEKIERAGIHVIANYIFGLPGETLTSMRETLDLALSLNTAFANFYCAMVYPGSPLHQTATNTTPEFASSNWEQYAQLGRDCKPLPTAELLPADIVRFRDLAFETYFIRPSYLEKIEATFGCSAISDISAMLSQKLIRSHV